MRLREELEKSREKESELPFGPVIKKSDRDNTESTKVSDRPSDAANNSKLKLISNIQELEKGSKNHYDYFKPAPMLATKKKTKIRSSHMSASA